MYVCMYIYIYIYITIYIYIYIYIYYNTYIYIYIYMYIYILQYIYIQFYFYLPKNKQRKSSYIYLPYQNTKYNLPDFNPYYLLMTHFFINNLFWCLVYYQILIFYLMISRPQWNCLYIIFPLNTTYNN